MLAFVVRRLFLAVPTAFLSTIIVFMLVHLLPGDPAQLLAGPYGTPETLSIIRERMGLNEPLPFQYVVWLGQIMRGDLGTSFISQVPVGTLIAQRAVPTLELAFTGIVLSTLFALTLGIVAAVKQRSAADWLITSFVGLAIAVPNFWMGILLIILFSIVLGWLPPGGRVDFSQDPALAVKSLVLPAFTLALPGAVALSRLVKSSLLGVLHQDYVRTAHAKGLDGATVVVRHALRNAMVPVITAIGLEFGRLLGGAVIIESIFGWTGLGSLMLVGISNRDYAVVQGGLLLLVLVFITINLLTDVSYGFLDPRIRVGSGRRR